jgi:hypothetical protein
MKRKNCRTAATQSLSRETFLQHFGHKHAVGIDLLWCSKIPHGS